MDSITSLSPLLTIFMPVYNAEAYIEKALENILAQKFPDYELLILDALSTDNTKRIIEEKQVSHSVIRFVSEKDKGIYDAMNKGIAAARGRWVYFMGCDDAFFDTYVLQNIAPALTEENDLVYGDVMWMPGAVLEEGICTPASLVNRNINHQRIFYRRSLFERHGSYVLQYKVASDHELNIRFFCNDEIRKKHVPVTIANYYAGGFSANKLDDIFWSQWTTIFKAHFLKHMPLMRMYEKLGWYCRYLIDRQQYAKAFPLFWNVLFNTWSPGFVWLTGKHFLRSFKQYAD